MNALKTYRLMLFLSIALNLVIGVFIFVAPDAFANVAGQPEAFPKAWPRHWGLQLWAINLLYLPGLRDPVRHRLQNWLGIIIRLTFAMFFFSQGDGFTPMGIYDGASGLLLLVTYLPALRWARRREEAS
jgi:hypothetical protein